MFQEDLILGGAEGLKIDMDREKAQRLIVYGNLIKKYNEKINLTRITGEREIIIKHFFDSLSVAGYLQKQSPGSLCDVGTGPGFPGIPLKIIFPEMKLTLIDSRKKAIIFLKRVIRELSLEGITLIQERVEITGQRGYHRERYPLVVARALAPLPVLAEMVLPLVKVGGHFYGLKGPGVLEEIKEGQRAVELLGGDIGPLEELFVPLGQEKRHLLIIKKVRPTPEEYPRRPGLPQKKPLV